MARFNLKEAWRKPKYLIPAVILPLAIYVGYIVSITQVGEDEEEHAVVTEGINTDLPEVNMERMEIKSKLQSMLDSYGGKQGDETAVTNIEREMEGNETIGSSYNEEERRVLDSIAAAREEEEKRIRDLIAQTERQADGEGRTRDLRDSADGSLDALERQMELIQRMAGGERVPTPEEERARAEQEAARIAVEKERKRVADSLAVLDAPAVVTKAGQAGTEAFNTVSETPERQDLIRATVDEFVKARDGSRLRLRLTDDVVIGGKVIPGGTYLYASVTGFSAQRVKAAVTSMMVGSEIRSVSLDVYDLDCQEGFYVPASSFREFTQDVGGSVNMNGSFNTGNTQTLSGMMMQSLQQALQQTSSAVTGSIRKNRARIKYNTQIYLINKK